MIRNVQEWQEFEDGLIAGQPVDFARNLRLYEAMYEYAVFLGVLPLKDPLEGLEEKIRWVRMLNVSAPATDAGDGA